MDDNNLGGGGGTGAFWIFALIILVVLFGGGLGGLGGGNSATRAATDYVAENFSQIQDSIRDVGDRQFTQTNNLTKGLADFGYSVAQQFGQLSSQLYQCCCETKMLISQLGAQIDQQTAAIREAVHAEGEATRGLIQTNEIQSLRDRLAAVEMDNRLCGVVRYATSSSYSAGPNPFGGYGYGGCGCN